MQHLISIVHVLACMGIIVLVLLQQGKGADMGASFGSGGANTVFGSRGSVPFFMKLTAALAAVFFTTSILLTRVHSGKPVPGFWMQKSAQTMPQPVGKSH